MSRTAHSTPTFAHVYFPVWSKMDPAAKDTTQLLVDWSNGDKQALDELMPLVYGELHRLAAVYLKRERPGHTLQPTALVHEAYVRLIDQSRVQWQNRAHFLGVAAQVLREAGGDRDW